MNLKKCKQLRRDARELTVGMPARRLIAFHGHAVNDPRSTRGVYRRLKVAARAP